MLIQIEKAGWSSCYLNDFVYNDYSHFDAKKTTFLKDFYVYKNNFWVWFLD